MTLQHFPAERTLEKTFLSIGFLTEMIDRLPWKTSGGRGAWESSLAALVLGFEPHCKTRRLLEALPAKGQMDKVSLLNAMANLGYIAKEEKTSLGEIDTRLLPCLFIPNGSSFPLVILFCEDGKIAFYDSESHEVRSVPSAECPHIRGGILSFSPYDRNIQPTSKFMRGSTGIGWFQALIKRFHSHFWQILMICFIINIFALAPALFIMLAYDRVISPYDISALPAIAAGVALALVAEWLLREIRAESLSWMTARMDNIVGGKIFAQLIGLPASIIEQASVSAQIARIKTFESVRDFFSSAVFLSFIEIPFVMIALGAMALIAGPLVVVPVLMIGAYGFLFFIMRHKIMNATRLAAKASSARQQMVIETFEKLRALRMNGMTEAWREKYVTLSGREITTSFQLGMLGTVAETLAHAMTVLAAVLTIGYGVHLIWAQGMSTGALIASMILVWRILLPFYSLCTMIPRLEQLRNSILQVNELMNLETEEDTALSNAALGAISGHIRIDNLRLRYNDGEDDVLHSLYLDLMPGQVAAITGKNGTGKTSILKLIKGLYRPDNGGIRIDGFDIRQMNAMELRRQIAYVPQTPVFFPISLKENLIIGNPFATMEEIETALRRADAWTEMKDHLDKDMAHLQMTETLAARLSLARAYIHNARILLVDELPNAVINGQAGHNLKEYIMSGKKQRTVILVSHRGDLIALADTIVHLKHHSAPMTGTRDDILKKLKEAA